VTFFIHETHDPQRVAGHMAASEPSSVGRLGPELRNMWQHQSPPQLGGWVWSSGTRGGTRALLSWKAGSKAAGHMAAPKLSSVGRRDPELWDTWQHQNPPQLGGGLRSYGTHGGIRALLSWEAGSGATGHMAAPEPYLAGRRSPEL
jgi:hypothetical protein